MINYHRLHSQIDWDYNAEEDTDIRKVIIATNVVETGVTLPAIRFVIDGMSEKTAELYDIRGMDGLKVRELDNSAMKQRMGRTGRQMNGYYIPLGDLSVVKDIEVTHHKSPAIHENPTNYMLKSILNFDDIEIPRKLFDPVNENIFKDCLSAITNLGFVDNFQKLTNIGWFVAHFDGFPPEIGVLVLAGCAFGCLSHSVILAATLCTPTSIFAYQREKRDTMRSGYTVYKRDSPSDHVALVEGYEDGYKWLNIIENMPFGNEMKAERKKFNELFSAPMLKVASANISRIGLVLARLGIIEIGDDWSNILDDSYLGCMKSKYNWTGKLDMNVQIGAFKAAILCAFGARFVSKLGNTFYSIGSEEALPDDIRPISVYFRSSRYSDNVTSAVQTPVTKEAYALFGNIFGHTNLESDTTIKMAQISFDSTAISFEGSMEDINQLFIGRHRLRLLMMSSLTGHISDDYKRVMLSIFSNTLINA